ncbi:MAG: glycosyltransferase family 2 protein [Chthonomonadales bacterium]|nr:glycosyltransferase family 2 protein [Chthonomonadales bacterium]
MTSVVVPAYNEAPRVGATVAAILTIPEVGEILVVDDGSVDDTAEQADAAGATVLRLPNNLGKAGALAIGVPATRGAIVMMLDADLGGSAAGAGLLLGPVASGEADMAIATFPANSGRRGGFGLVVALARWGIRRATGRAMVAPLSGQRAFIREVWDRAGGRATGFGVETAFTIDALRAGFRVVEVPTTMSHRATGRDLTGFRHRARQLAAVARALAPRLRR